METKTETEAETESMEAETESRPPTQGSRTRARTRPRAKARARAGARARVRAARVVRAGPGKGTVTGFQTQPLWEVREQNQQKTTNACKRNLARAISILAWFCLRLTCAAAPAPVPA